MIIYPFLNQGIITKKKEKKNLFVQARKSYLCKIEKHIVFFYTSVFTTREEGEGEGEGEAYAQDRG